MITPEPRPSSTPKEHPQADPLDPAFQDALVDGAARLTPDQAIDLWHRMPLADLGGLADRRCKMIHGDSIRTYVIDRNINYTNVCTAKCTFCAFRRDQGDRRRLHARVRGTAAARSGRSSRSAARRS